MKNLLFTHVTQIKGRTVHDDQGSKEAFWCSVLFAKLDKRKAII